VPDAKPIFTTIAWSGPSVLYVTARRTFFTFRAKDGARAGY